MPLISNTSIIETTLEPTRDECEQIWSAATTAFHNAMPEGKMHEFTPEDTTRMRLAAGRAAWDKVQEIRSRV